MTKADKLRMLFPGFIGHVDIELEHMEGSHRITFINVPGNIFETTFRFTEECGCCHYYDTERVELDCNEEGVNSLTDIEFEILINEIQ